MTKQPSIPHPENAERRAAITRETQATTGLDEAVLERLVRNFYATARWDEVIGHLFNGVHDWEKHIAKIAAFWSSVALQTGRYHGQPLEVHYPLKLEPPHFTRWLALFERTVCEVCLAAGADLLIEKAHRSAHSLEMGVAVGRGELPSRMGARA
jgi:hemoglobin